MGLVSVPRANASNLAYHWANPGASLEQNIGIIVASIPAFRQLFTVFKKHRNTQHSHTSEKPFAGANPFITSPLSPLTEEEQTGHIPFPNSPVSSITKTMEIKLETDNGNTSSPTTSMVPRLELINLPTEKAHRGKGQKIAKAKECNEISGCNRKWECNKKRECNKKWEQRRESRPTLGNLAVLGYSCNIEGGSPKLTV